MLANSRQNFSRFNFVYKNTRLFALLGCILIIISRDVSLILRPRFWTEEGNVYFSYAFGHSWFETLISPHVGYYSFFDNVTSLAAANLVPLQFAPLVTTIAALLIQLTPISIVLFGNSLLWQDRTKKGLAIGVILFTMLSNELWLNTNNSQFYLSLTTFLILEENLENITSVRAWVYRSLLALAGLTGPVGCFLTPLFIYRAWVEKKRENIIQAGILVACTLFQIIILGVITLTDKSVPPRFSGFDVSIFIQTIWIKNLVLPFLGPNITQGFSEILESLSAGALILIILLDSVLLLLIILFFRFLTKRIPRYQAILMFGSYFVITLASFLSSVGDKSGLIYPTDAHRYFFVPNVIVMFLILLNIDFSKAGLKFNRQLLPTLLLTLALLFGIFYFYYYHFPNFSNWSEEVAKWEADPNYQLQISPQGWTMELKK